MNENMKKLKLEFEYIKKIGWIETAIKGPSGVGITFERLLHKEIENFEIPDYEDIEIKTRSADVKKYITLFNCTPDETYLFEIKRICGDYGLPDKIVKSQKVFYGLFYANKKSIVGNHLFKLKVDRYNERIYLCVYDRNNNLIDDTTFWSFELLNEKLQRKMKLLALVNASYKKEFYQVYYKYTAISFYKLKDFDSFIQAIEKGIIRIVFKIGVFRSGRRFGQLHDHGTGFELKFDSIGEIYNLIE